MDKIGIVLTSKTVVFKYIPKKILALLPQRWINWLIIRFKKETYHEFDLVQMGIGIKVAQMPIISEQLKSTDERVLKHFLNAILNQFKQAGIKHVVLHKKMNDMSVVQDVVYTEQCFIKVCEDILLTALSIDIVKKICKAKGLDMNATCVGIVEKKLTKKSLFIIEQLSPHIRYITMVTDNAEEAQQQLDAIYEEMGLAVRVSNSANVSLKAADIIIVLDDMNAFLKNTQINIEATLLNFSGKKNISAKSTHIIINYVEIQGNIALESNFTNWHDICKDTFIKNILMLKSNSSTYYHEKEIYQNMRILFYKMNLKIKDLIYYKKQSVKYVDEKEIIIDNRPLVVYNIKKLK